MKELTVKDRQTAMKLVDLFIQAIEKQSKPLDFFEVGSCDEEEIACIREYFGLTISFEVQDYSEGSPMNILIRQLVVLFKNAIDEFGSEKSAYPSLDHLSIIDLEDILALLERNLQRDRDQVSIYN